MLTRCRIAFLCLLMPFFAGPVVAGGADNIATGNEPPHALTERGLENLHAFARLYCALGYFHPSDQVRATDWDQFSIAGVQKIEGAKNPEELAKALRALFLPIAPTVRIYLTGTTPPPPSSWLAPRDRRGLVLVGFRYDGCPGNSGGYYRELLFPLKRPEAPYAANLGGGVSAIVPLTLYRDASGTLPHETSPDFIKPDKPNGFAPSGNDRATRLADVVAAWNIFQHFYPYFDIEPVDWSAELDKALREAATDNDELAFRDTLLRMVAALRDGHGWVHLNGLSEYDLPLAWDWVKDQLVVTAVGPNVTGIARGDIVLKIGGRDIGDVIKDAAPLAPAATEQWRRVVMASNLLRRTRADPVQIEVRHADGSAADVSPALIKYEKGPSPIITEAPSLDPSKQVQPGVWYVDLSRTDGKALETQMPQLAKARGIVFDLRDYPANDAWQVVRHLSGHNMLVGRFIVPIATRPDRQNATYDERTWFTSPLSPRLHGKIVFLCGGGTISQGEMIMSIVDDYHLGEIVGGPTAGTDGNVDPFTLPGGYWISWTGMRVERQDGSRFMGVGVKPNVLVYRTIAGIRAGRDEVLEKGLAVAESESVSTTSQ